ncbi:pantoate--beta-alanine ligase [Catenulispora sp. NF23]|uniref:pantoate--beta-alanine ligase n=1 Tax=Catenulispora pinistramenti TaxID=2705254 RepID=UPI001BA8ED63|nr:pantoate--beta-alanine ligase [Catenulispora pinistramenti]MBS2534903.1 pantoate--beta-alanine ligase [Catenulispora pinistramenti]
MTALVHTRAELQPFLEGFANRKRGVVMTMGALHEGHLELFKRARHDCDLVVATIFVNPLQFGPNEDFDRYPRTLDDDLKLCAEAGVDVVYAPAVEEVYPGGQPIVRVTPGAMGEVLEGEFRPGFFTGVLTIVNKLLNLTDPDVAFFGQKDAQQLALVRRMVLDLNMPIEIVGVPTVRDEDGLAKSSRNRYLSSEERTTALALSRALFAGQEKATEGADAVRAAATAVLKAAVATGRLDLDYLALVDPRDFSEAPPTFSGETVLAVAARVGTTRLIDNLPLTLTTHGAR